MRLHSRSTGLSSQFHLAKPPDRRNKALELDRTNWRTYNNRAAVFVGLKQFELAMTDVNTGLEIAPQSGTLQKSREVVIEHRNAASRERWRKPNKA